MDNNFLAEKNLNYSICWFAIAFYYNLGRALSQDNLSFSFLYIISIYIPFLLGVLGMIFFATKTKWSGKSVLNLRRRYLLVSKICLGFFIIYFVYDVITSVLK